MVMYGDKLQNITKQIMEFMAQFPLLFVLLTKSFNTAVPILCCFQWLFEHLTRAIYQPAVKVIEHEDEE